MREALIRAQPSERLIYISLVCGTRTKAVDHLDVPKGVNVLCLCGLSDMLMTAWILPPDYRCAYCSVVVGRGSEHIASYKHNAQPVLLMVIVGPCDLKRLHPNRDIIKDGFIASRYFINIQ